MPLIPAADDIPTTRPPWLVVALLVANVVAYAVADRGGLDGSLAGLVATMLALWIYGSTVEHLEGRTVAAVVYTAGAGLALLIALALADGTASAAVAGAGGAAALAGTHLGRHPRAKVLSVSVVPPFAGVLPAPSPLFAAAWIAVQAAVAFAAPLAPAGDVTGVAYAVAAIAPLAVGLAAAGMLRRRAIGGEPSHGRAEPG